MNSAPAVTLPAHMPPMRLATAVAGACVWLLDLRDEPDADAWQACQASEHARAARFKSAEHARRYRAAHAGLRELLAAQLGVAMQDWAWEAGQHGKPHFALARHGYFSLSHSEDWALLAWHPNLPVGVDIEWQRAVPGLENLARHHLAPVEQAWMDEGNDAAVRESRFHRLWCAKEAALKALGSGLLVAPQRVAVDGGRPGGVVHIDLGPADARAAHSRCRLTVTEIALPQWLRARAALAVVAAGDQSLCW
jgi:4'-phosphopantetheinyl transferase